MDFADSVTKYDRRFKVRPEWVFPFETVPLPSTQTRSIPHMGPRCTYPQVYIHLTSKHLSSEARPPGSDTSIHKKILHCVRHCCPSSITSWGWQSICLARTLGSIPSTTQTRHGSKRLQSQLLKSQDFKVILYYIVSSRAA